MSWVLWSILSALFGGATAVLAKIGVVGVDSNFATAIRASAIFVVVWIIALATGAPAASAGLGATTYVPLVLSGVAGGLSWFCYFRALQVGEASRVAPVDKLSIVFVIVLAALFLGERLTAAKVIGGLLIVSGAILVVL